MLETEQKKALELTQHWLEQVVVGMNLCPFAKPVLKNNSIHYAVTDQSEWQSLSQFFLQELTRIAQADEQQISTSLLIIPQGLSDFYDYLDFVSDCEDLIRKAGLTDQFQLASFHPQYIFAQVDPEDVSHWTNRSPYPIVHIIREEQMSTVLEKHPNPDSIAQRNIALFQDMGKDALIERFPHFKQ